MATASVQSNNFNASAFRTSTSHPDLGNPQLMVDSLLRHKLESLDQMIQTMKQELTLEKDRNRILVAQVNSLEAVIAQLLNQAEQYHYEALVNEKRVKDLEAKLDKEASKRHAHVKTVQKLENAVDRVKTLEKQLKVQVDMRANETMSDDQLAWSVVENVGLRERNAELEQELKYQMHKVRIAPEVLAHDDSLSADVAAAAVEMVLVKDRIAMDLRFAPSETSPCEEYAVCAVENAALKAQISDIVGAQALKNVADIQAEMRSEVVNEQMEQLKDLEAQFDKLSAACVELESRRTSITAESARIISSLSSADMSVPDEQLAYALVENVLLKGKYGDN
eukprot:TRINITY_DN672_c0_g1_i1.p1 TRINITY_DN672_c0_g1~~TRINITY_DN672_c0_g1_i1.p1  ORF type:complete len:337 (+),score=92.17 TRINITY_DN672_c0_g1_i1:188-1198(+)